MKRIAIVGAGMGGLSALNTLAKAGCEVTVFDKSRGSGGRMATKKLNDASWDMGTQFLRSHSDEFRQQLQHWQQQGWIDAWPVTLDRIDHDGIHASHDDVERFVGVSRMTALCRQLLAPAHEFHTSTRIVRCDKQAEGWWLEDEQGQQFGHFDGLIINTPPEQAQPLLTASPTLQAHPKPDMLPCWTLLVAFELPLASTVNAAFVSDSPIAWIARNSSKPQRDSLQTWVIQAEHDWSAERVDSPREQVQETLLAAFFDALKLPAQPCTEIWLHRWLYAIPAAPLEQGALIDPAQQLAVCGDWCHSASVEGAWLSGQAAARGLLES